MSEFESKYTAALLPVGSSGAVEAEREAREILLRLGADALTERLDTLLAARPASDARPATQTREATWSADRAPSMEA